MLWPFCSLMLPQQPPPSCVPGHENSLAEQLLSLAFWFPRGHTLSPSYTRFGSLNPGLETMAQRLPRLMVQRGPKPFSSPVTAGQSVPIPRAG